MCRQKYWGCRQKYCICIVTRGGGRGVIHFNYDDDNGDDGHDDDDDDDDM